MSHGARQARDALLDDAELAPRGGHELEAMRHEPPCGPGAHRTVRPEPRLEEEAFVNVYGAPQDAMAQGVVPGDPLDGEAILEDEGREGIGRGPGPRLAPCRLTEPI